MNIPFYRWGLETKFSLTLLIVVCSIASMISASIIRMEKAGMEDELRDMGISAAHALARLSVEPVMREQLWDLYEITKIMTKGDAPEKNILVYAMIMDRNGVLLSHSDPIRFKIGSSLESDPIYISASNTEGAQIVDVKGMDGEPILDISSPIILDGQRIGTVRVGVTKRYMSEALKKQGLTVLVISSMLALFGLIGGLFIARRMTRPLKELSGNMKALSAGLPIGERAVILKEKDEIGKLADTFNYMAKTLREKERLLVRSERLASIGEFAAGLAHEIRNPLGSVVTAVNLLSFGNVSAQEEAALKGVVKKETERLNRILGDFLIFARPLPPKMAHADLNEILKETLEMAKRNDLFSGDISVNLDLDEEMKPLKLDPDQMRQVFWNIYINSIHAMKDGGNLTLVSRVTDDRAVVSVIDTGHGMEEEDMEKIFEPFYTTKEDGTGLGLAIVSRIIEAHGGRISVESRVGEGTTFMIEIPAVREV